jgi:uncharacterized repeat protein (TIGR03803 family)
MMCMVVLFCVAAVIAAPAQSGFFTSLASFDGANGANPQAALIQGTDGNFYGTAAYGGANGVGVVFRITPAGTLTTLYSFCYPWDCPGSGYEPTTGLIQASDGNLYGTTSQGGTLGYGTLFQITPAGTLTLLYTFNGSDGTGPSSALVQASDGDFYGTTSGGGTSNNCGSNGCGTVFKITPSGMLTTLHSFEGSDGIGPSGALVQASDGDFYGTTLGGGAYSFGTIFKITLAGTLTTLYTFDGYQGVFPNGLVQASDGNFYGTTSGGGSDGSGTVFEITPAGSLTTLYSFFGPTGDLPEGGIIQARDGNFYGTTRKGGDLGCTSSGYGCGTVYRITPIGSLSTLHSFNLRDGYAPCAGLVQARDGSFYGTTTYGGGDFGDGTFFRVGVVNSCATCRP